jgi:lysophospholipase L1-like esterase
LIVLDWRAPKKSTNSLVVATFFVITAVMFFSFASGRAFGQGEDSVWASSVLEPFWISSRMTEETAMFVQRPEEQAATARLLFVPARILRVTSANGAAIYEQDRDYVWKSGSNILTLTSNSRIPVTTWARLHPAKGAPMSLGESADGKSALLFQEPGDFFQGLQVAVTYDHQKEWNGEIPHSAQKDLPRTIAKLQTKRLKLVVFGDSVSAGAGASGDFHKAPNQPPYTELVAQGLCKRYGAEINVANLAEGGQDSTWAVKMAYKAAAQNPDLVIVGFGGNDATRGVSAESFAQNIQTVIDTIRKTAPNADFILIATMTANPDWPESKATLCRQYRDALVRLAGPGVAVADEFSMWQELVKRKKFLDLTANGINHPNDFGHRVYAQVVLQLLQ